MTTAVTVLDHLRVKERLLRVLLVSLFQTVAVLVLVSFVRLLLLHPFRAAAGSPLPRLKPHPVLPRQQQRRPRHHHHPRIVAVVG